MQPLYHYQCTLKRIIDGDTLIVQVDLGFKTYAEKTIRLAGINAPELNSQDPAEVIRAQDAKVYLTVITLNQSLFLESNSLDNYGRSIGTVYVGKNPISINHMMLDAGHASPYKTH